MFGPNTPHSDRRRHILYGSEAMADGQEPEPPRDEADFDPSFCRKLLLCEATPIMVAPPNGFGWPRTPLASELSRSLFSWISTETMPGMHANLGLNETNDVRLELAEAMQPLLVRARHEWGTMGSGEREALMRDILHTLAPRGVLLLLGLRPTRGSLCLVPPPLRSLVT